jgi:hypothetical protein
LTNLGTEGPTKTEIPAKKDKIVQGRLDTVITFINSVVFFKKLKSWRKCRSTLSFLGNILTAVLRLMGG